MRALVTGGTRGIGLACCRLFAEAGYAVTATYSSDEAAAQRARELLPAVRFLRADAASEEDTARVFAALPSLDVLVCNAGVSHFSQVQDEALADWERVMAVNAGGVFLAVKYATKKLLASCGAIVNISSVWGVTGGSCESVYSASKGAVVAFTRALAKELAPAVTVNCIAPGVIDTAMNARFSEGERAALCGEIPLGRFGSPEEVAEAALFLARARYVTGQVLGVDGGFGL